MLTKFTLYFTLISVLTGCAHKEKKTIVSPADSIIQAEGISFIENEGTTMVTAPCDGKIIYIRASQGMQVNAGKTIALIENIDLLILQKEYLEAKNELEFSSREYARQGDLTVENATSLKKMEIARHDYQAADLRYKSLRKQLTLLGIQPDSISPENMQAGLLIRSPIKGIITSAPGGKGYFVKKGDPLFEISGSQNILLQLEIPEASVWQIQIDQKVLFHTVSDTSLIMEAYINLTPKSVDPVKHTTTVVAKPASGDSRLLPGMSVRATIFVSDSKE